VSWYRDFFASGDYARLYADGEEPERAAVEAGFAARSLGLKPGARVLDLCCGKGRHTRALRALGFQVVGLDLQPLGDAQADMRALPFRAASFDAVVSFFSSFGYLESDDEDAQVLREVSRVLKPGGALFLDLLNREHALGGFVSSVQRVEEDGTLVAEQRSWDARRGRLTTGFVIVDPGGARRDSLGHSLRLYTLTELDRLFAQAGLALQANHGSFHGEPFSLESVRMISVAAKPG
jgi:SAM-dependent methyltransferase